MVNMAGCEWGRDCWGEMYWYRELSNRLNRNWRERVSDWWNEQFKKQPAAEKEQKQEEKKEE
jgi:mannan polymerase II complex MNN10 subunit